MNAGLEALPDDIDALKAALIVARAEAAAARAQQSDDQALIAHLKLQIEKLNRDRYGPRSERTARLLDQLELTLEELESSATEDELTAEMAAAKTMKVASFTRKRPSRQPFPEHLPRERLMVPGPTACACCGGSRSEFVLRRRAFQLLQCQLELIQQPRGALRAWTIAVAVKFLDLQLQMSDQRLIIGLLSSGSRGLCASNNQRRFQRVNVIWQSFETSIHDC